MTNIGTIGDPAHREGDLVPPRSEDEIAALTKELEKHGLGGINPDANQIHDLIAADRDGPLQFVNLLCYYDRARYPKGHQLEGTAISGADAYARYGMIALEHVTNRGGHLALYNDVDQVLIGGHDRWDQVAIMEYANTEAFLDMILDPDYVAGLVHREAGLASTLVMVTRSLLPPAA
jgi:uncharacterized protein (DUF1330 family)